MVSAAVLSALPLELPPLLLEMLFVSALASAFESSELVLDALDAALTALGAITPETVPPGICVCCVPLGLPAAVLRKIWLSVSGYCQYCGATSITTKYWLIAL